MLSKSLEIAVISLITVSTILQACGISKPLVWCGDLVYLQENERCQDRLKLHEVIH